MLESPSRPLFPESRDSRRGAAEIKFRLDADRVEEIRDFARAELAPDPYAAGPHGDEYATTSLYFDTNRFDVYHRRGSYGRSKYRIRRYGRGTTAFLERKLRTAGWVVKRRTTIPIADLARFGSANGALDAAAFRMESGDGWSGRWFERRLHARRLGPVCQVSYQRLARVGTTSDGPFRLTIDQSLAAAPAPAAPFSVADDTPILVGACILELKYRGSAPAVFRRLVERFALVAQPLSKYRVALEALGAYTS